MKKIWVYIPLIALSLSLTACNNKSDTKKAETRTSVKTNEKKNTRRIKDLADNEVEIPIAADIKRVVIVSPPVMSFAIQTMKDTNMIVGISSRAFTTSNPVIVNKEFPNWKSVDTTFIDGSFTVNKESLLKLKPDIIFYYGNIQKQGLGNVNIPSIDFFSKKLKGPKAFSIAFDNLLRDIFELKSSQNQQQEWNLTEKKSAELLKNKGKQKSALCVVLNQAGKIKVSGMDSFDAYAQSYFEIAGIRNVASELKGTKEVSMEKIYEWNPDMIIVVQDAPAKSILDNTIEGQDWSLLTAWKNKAVFDVPRTTFSWITPCADAPLMPLWLLSKSYPTLLNDEQMRKEISAYYQRNYHTTLSDSDLNSILGYRKAMGS